MSCLSKKLIKNCVHSLKRRFLAKYFLCKHYNDFFKYLLVTCIFVTKNIHENVPISSIFLLKVNLKMFFVFKKEDVKTLKGHKQKFFFWLYQCLVFLNVSSYQWCIRHNLLAASERWKIEVIQVSTFSQWCFDDALFVRC